MSSDTARLTNILGAFAVALTDAIEAALEADTPLCASQVAGLIQIGSFSGESSQELAQALGLTQSGTARLLQRLKALGLIETAPAAHDGRAIAVRLTAAGQREHQRALARRHAALATVTRSLGATEQRSLLSVMEKVFPLLVASRPASDHVCRYCDAGYCPPQACPAEIDSPVYQRRSQALARAGRVRP